MFLPLLGGGININYKNTYIVIALTEIEFLSNIYLCREIITKTGNLIRAD